MAKSILSVVRVFLFVLCSLTFTHRAIASDPAQEYIAIYDGLLKQYVAQGHKSGIDAALVDYAGWAKDPRHAEALRLLQSVNPDTLAGQDAMAFWINAYNLLTIDLITQHAEIASIKDLGSLFKSPWKTYQWAIGGRTYTLDDIEHNNLRKRGDPRVHMALVCASLSCPDLRAEAYTADRLDSQLDTQAQLFLNNTTKGLAITSAGLVLSPILKWYAEDFGGKEGVLKFIAAHHKTNPTAADIADYFDYNWQLNRP